MMALVGVIVMIMDFFVSSTKKSPPGVFAKSFLQTFLNLTLFARFEQAVAAPVKDGDYDCPY